MSSGQGVSYCIKYTIGGKIATFYVNKQGGYCTNKTSVAGLTKARGKAKIGFLQTIAADGSIDSRPIGVPQKASDGTVWLVTNKNSNKAAQIAAHPEVTVSFASGGAVPLGQKGQGVVIDNWIVQGFYTDNETEAIRQHENTFDVDEYKIVRRFLQQNSDAIVPITARQVTLF